MFRDGDGRGLRMALLWEVVKGMMDERELVVEVVCGQWLVYGFQFGISGVSAFFFGGSAEPLDLHKHTSATRPFEGVIIMFIIRIALPKLQYVPSSFLQYSITTNQRLCNFYNICHNCHLYLVTGCRCQFRPFVDINIV